jgi:hypothetical protein
MSADPTSPQGGAAVNPAQKALLYKWRDERKATTTSSSSADPTLADAVAADAAAFLTDRTLIRYLRARGTAERAGRALSDTLAWRAANIPPPASLPCPTCALSPSAHCFLPLGHTKGGFPVVYGSVPRAGDYETAPAVSHFVRVLESVLAHPASTERLVWVFDMTGFGIRHALLVSIAVRLATTFAWHYPERLEEVLLLNPPRAWEAMLACVRPLLDSKTLGKVRTLRVREPTAARAALAGLEVALRDETIEWIVGALQTEPVPGTLPPLPAGAATFTPRISPLFPVTGVDDTAAAAAAAAALCKSAAGAPDTDPCDSGSGCAGGSAEVAPTSASGSARPGRGGVVCCGGGGGGAVVVPSRDSAGSVGAEGSMATTSSGSESRGKGSKRKGGKGGK